MAVTLHISDSITAGLRLPEGEIEERLRLELALALYGQGILSFGKAAELAGADWTGWAIVAGRKACQKQGKKVSGRVLFAFRPTSAR